MKTIKLLSLFLLLTSLSGCSSSSNNNPTNSKINGVWNLRYVNGSIAGVNYVFEPGVVIWTFNSNSHLVTVENNNTDNNLNPLLSSGVYPYTISNNQSTASCGQSIEINSQDMGCVLIDSDGLFITETFADGFQIQLVR